MALAPQFRSHRLGSESPNARHVLELYVDFVCPFSAKQVLGIRDHLMPLLKDKDDQLSIILRQTPQPWHASSTLVHQAALAVSRLAPEKFWEFSAQFYDEPTLDETPRKTRDRLADLAHKSVGVDRDAFLQLVLTGGGNKGSKVDADLKLQVKLGRQNGIHVTPTCCLDGLVDPSIQSSFGKKEWEEWLAKLS